MDTDMRDIVEITRKDFETIQDDKAKSSKTVLPLITKKLKSKNRRQGEGDVYEGGVSQGGVSQFMEKAQALGFSFEECQKLFLLYGRHL